LKDRESGPCGEFNPVWGGWATFPSIQAEDMLMIWFARCQEVCGSANSSTGKADAACRDAQWRDSEPLTITKKRWRYKLYSLNSFIYPYVRSLDIELVDLQYDSGSLKACVRSLLPERDEQRQRAEEQQQRAERERRRSWPASPVLAPATIYTQLYLTQLLTTLSQVRKSELPKWFPDHWKKLRTARPAS